MIGQGLSGPLHFYGLWEGFHPVEIILDDQGEGSLLLPDEPFPIQLHAQQQGDRWKIHEVIPDGSISGTWIVGPQSDHWLGEWSNYNQSTGSLCALFPTPVEAPKTFSVRFFFKDGKKKWSFILFPLPRGKWKGLAWEANQKKLTPVNGEWLASGILLSMDDPQSGQHHELTLLTDRQAWRSAKWTDQQGKFQRVHLRKFRTDPVRVTAFLDYSREILLLQPELGWPMWEEFLEEHLIPAREAFEVEYRGLMIDHDGQRPFQRHAVRLYSWVDWSYRDRKVASGTLYVVGSWGPTTRTPFTMTRKSGKVTLADLWPDGLIPLEVKQQLISQDPNQPVRIDPISLHIGPAGQEVTLLVQDLIPKIPRSGLLHDLFAQ